jgi:hypothetical protein
MPRKSNSRSEDGIEDGGELGEIVVEEAGG